MDTHTLYHTADSFEIGAIHLLSLPGCHESCVVAAATCLSTCISSINTRSRQTDDSSTVDASSRMVHQSDLRNKTGIIGI